MEWYWIVLITVGIAFVVGVVAGICWVLCAASESLRR